MAVNFRSLFRYLLPARFTTGEGEKVLHSLALLKDIWGQRARMALEERYPSRCAPSTLAMHAHDRNMLRGRIETTDHFRTRLQGFRYPKTNRLRGNPWALLEQIAEYFSDGTSSAKAWTIDARGNRFNRTALGVESYVRGYGWDWDGAPSTPRWARFWVVLDKDTPGTALDIPPAVGDADLWGGSIGNPGYCVGLVGITPEQVDEVRGLLRGSRPWKPNGTRAEWLIIQIAPGGGIDGDPLPEGNWGSWSVNIGGLQLPARGGDLFRFVSFTPERNNNYVGDPTNFPDAVRLPGDDSDYTGDPTNFPDAVVMADGHTYTGNPAVWHDSVRLLDDGDAVR